MIPTPAKNTPRPGPSWGRRAAAVEPVPDPAGAGVSAGVHVSAQWGRRRNQSRPLAPNSQTLSRPFDESMVISFAVCAVLSIAFLLVSDSGRHWFVLPVFLCGGLIVADAVDWFRGRLDVFDPVGIFGVFGFYFFFVAPLVHVLWDKWMLWIVPPPDWRPWVGAMAWFNFAGLLLYRWVRGRFASPQATNAAASASASNPRGHVWVIDDRVASVAIGIALAVTAVVQAYIYIKVGGFSGYVEASGRRDVFLGMAPLVIVGESFPLFAFLAFALFVRRRHAVRSWSVISAALLGFLLLLVVFGGLRGSRMNTIWPLFWAVGVVHYWIWPVSRKVLAVGLCFLIGFMYLYGFYKSLRGDIMDVFRSGSIRDIESATGRTLDLMLLGDFGRTDIQAFLLYRYARPESDYQLAWGETYVGALTLFVPRTVWPDRPVGKVRQGTDLQYGDGVYSECTASSRIYGLAGETLLNFGPWAIPPAFVLLGLLVRAVRAFAHSLHPTDTRLLIMPFLIGCCVWAVVGDLDNVIWFMTKCAVLPFALLYVCSVARPNPEETAGAATTAAVDGGERAIEPSPRRRSWASRARTQE